MKRDTVTHLALLRGVNNVGSQKRVAMADLRALFEELGFFNVQTVLNSGNVIFSATSKSSSTLRSRIERALFAKLGLSSLLTLLTADELKVAVRRNPLARIATNPSDLLVFIPQNGSDIERLKPLLKRSWAPEVFALKNRVAYLWCANGVARSPLWASVDRALEYKGTVRNINTLTKASFLVGLES